jgi:GT2 family glycosyltransferase
VTKQFHSADDRNSPTKSPIRARQVFIVLLNWEQWRLTVECLISLQAINYEEWKVIVLDNGSRDDSVDRIREKCPDVEVVELGENLGFAKGNNAGIRMALERGAEYVWLLNSDTTVDALALQALVEEAEADPKVGAVGSAIYHAADPERLQAWGGGRVNFWLGRSRYFTTAVNDDQIEFLSGASLFLRRSALESLGLLDEGFFFYWEDTDYCFRLRRAGWRLVVAGESKVWHVGEASVGKTSTRLDDFFSASAVRFFEQHSPVPWVSVWLGVTLRVLKRLVRGKWNNALTVWASTRQASFPFHNQRDPQIRLSQPKFGDISPPVSGKRANKTDT